MPGLGEPTRAPLPAYCAARIWQSVSEVSQRKRPGSTRWTLRWLARHLHLTRAQGVDRKQPPASCSVIVLIGPVWARALRSQISAEDRCRDALPARLIAGGARVVSFVVSVIRRGGSSLNTATNQAERFLSWVHHP
ncbi:hypothetical protein C7S18_14355 [Ahniella affigens]|uniref:Uncharacterized protein n=1 Tax=Ahniella affigens TaxID=2021234 RepID=A0A2P1PU02_9GAMM|nr:hypothetical protein C7S18_14355 [Ahniella affigens]